MTDILRKIAELERELGPLPPSLQRQSYLDEIAMVSETFECERKDGTEDPDFFTNNADRLWLEQLILLKSIKDRSHHSCSWAMLLTGD